ncbi:sigma-70 family RNA polymerase sigma factor [Cytobacillus spongiae]|uniref:RNA polymerase sigma factor n=1 Tax=Cytobacillus spongiae TaxID=2901381 RepID=UPI001F3A97E5|nr:sigma-70 family RNA polymerase sigma factor [Cytobacillus spongiae]UII56789.1 sigma-70 family RNA polymerase sigma factor [Cytobacillus spongiae]
MNLEQQWIKKVKKKASSEAANKLISSYYKEIYAFVYKQTLDAELSLDITQEIFISVLKSINRFDEKKASFRTWLYRIASNRLVDYYRSKQYQYSQQSETIEGYEFENEEDVIVQLEYKEDVERIASIVNRLESSTQQVVRLKLFAEYTLPEIAEVVQMPLSTVKTKYYTAIKKIKKEIKEQEDE